MSARSAQFRHPSAGRSDGRFIDFGVSDASFKKFQKDLQAVSKDLQKEVNAELREVIKRTILPTARQNASWSTRIPGALRQSVTTKFAGLAVSRKKAPHGALYERGNDGRRDSSSFRHPVFGNRNFWVVQQTRPFMRPAIAEHRDDAVEAAEDAVLKVVGRAGFG